MLVDARCFRDPHKGQFRSHVGYHPRIVEGLCKSPLVVDWLLAVQQALRRVTSSRGTCLQIAVFCNAGRHRSVAGALILKHILTLEGWECPLLRHLSRAAWAPTCGGRCGECTSGPPESLRTALDALYRVWKEEEHGPEARRVCHTRDFKLLQHGKSAPVQQLPEVTVLRPPWNRGERFYRPQRSIRGERVHRPIRTNGFSRRIRR